MANLSKERQAALLKILNYIQDDGDFDTAKQMFKENFDQVDVSEITEAERQLIAHGLDPRKIQALCNVHVDLFRGNIQAKGENPDFVKPGHPVNTFKQENVVIKSLINDYLLPNLNKWEENSDAATLKKLQKALKDLATIDKHYSRKETSMFPIMNKYGFTAPPEVMWGVDDDIRGWIKDAQKAVNAETADPEKIDSTIKKASHEVLEMIDKEEDIMIPLIDEKATAEDWYVVKQEEPLYGYTLISKPMNWKPKKTETKTNNGNVDLASLSSLFINFKEGSLNIEQLQAIVNMLPFELTFVDKNNKVAFFGGAPMILKHSKNAIGNDVMTCHTPEIKPKVKAIFTAFKSGQKDEIAMHFTRKDGHTIYIRYFAVRDKGQYLGCLEIVQDVTEILKW